jgi:hypothetical protein
VYAEGDDRALGRWRVTVLVIALAGLVGFFAAWVGEERGRRRACEVERDAYRRYWHSAEELLRERIEELQAQARRAEESPR